MADMFDFTVLGINDSKEEILTENRNRFVVFPLVYHDVWQMFKTAEASLWTAQEVDMSKDYDDWVKMTDNERNFLSNVLAFFAASDGIVNENLAMRFYNDVKIPEAKAFYAYQLTIETIHSESYSLMIDTLIKDTKEKNMLFDAMNTVPAVGLKAKWAMKWISSNAPFAVRLLAFAIVEGIYFSGSFCALYWLKESGRCNGLTNYNILISRDESLHTEFAILLYSKLTQRLPEDVVHMIVKEAVDIEIEFITKSIPCKMLNMNSELMEEYIKFVADRLLVQFGYSKIYKAHNPFPFMDRIAMENKVNFFESRNVDYSKAKVGQTGMYEFALDAAF